MSGPREQQTFFRALDHLAVITGTLVAARAQLVKSGVELEPDEWVMVAVYRRLDSAGRERDRTAL
ncbi:MAG: hypothetical protein JWO45_210 [Spartobacteria bacterium]|nr:hypothetical protein [Spartobacteria bacterium]